MTTTMDVLDVEGTLTFAALEGGTLVRWSWALRPKGALRLLGPLVAWTGRRREAAVWAGLKRHLEACAALTSSLR